MKPKDLTYPFTHTAKEVSFHDGILFVPPLPERNTAFGKEDWPGLFPLEQPLAIEYCSGNGAWISNCAENNPGVNWVAIEKKFPRVRKIWSKMKNRALHNLLPVCGEAMMTTEKYIPSETVSKVFVNFPDPWPKARHAKHRLLNKPFFDEAARIMLPQAELTIVTDDVPYRDQIVDTLSSHPEFEPIDPFPYYLHDLHGYGDSYFETLWREKGKMIHYMRFKRRPH